MLFTSDSREKCGALGALLSMLGQRGPGPMMIMREGTRSTVGAMRSAGYVCCSSLRRRFIRQWQGHRRAATTYFVAERGAGVPRDGTRRHSKRNGWTIARPPRLTNGPLTKRYTSQMDECHAANCQPTDVALFYWVSFSKERTRTKIAGRAHRDSSRSSFRHSTFFGALGPSMITLRSCSARSRLGLILLGSC